MSLHAAVFYPYIPFVIHVGIDMSRWKSSSSPKDGAVVVDSSGWWTGNYNDLHNILCEMCKSYSAP